MFRTKILIPAIAVAAGLFLTCSAAEARPVFVRPAYGAPLYRPGPVAYAHRMPYGAYARPAYVGRGAYVGRPAYLHRPAYVRPRPYYRAWR